MMENPIPASAAGRYSISDFGWTHPPGSVRFRRHLRVSNKQPYQYNWRLPYPEAGRRANRSPIAPRLAGPRPPKTSTISAPQAAGWPDPVSPGSTRPPAGDFASPTKQPPPRSPDRASCRMAFEVETHWRRRDLDPPTIRLCFQVPLPSPGGLLACLPIRSRLADQTRPSLRRCW